MYFYGSQVMSSLKEKSSTSYSCILVELEMSVLYDYRRLSGPVGGLRLRCPGSGQYGIVKLFEET